MPPHTTLQYTMPSNTTTNSKPTSITSSSGITQLAATPKPSNTNATSRQRRATSASSYVFAPSWLINNKTVPAVTEGKSTKEDAKGVGSSKKDELGVVKQVKDGNSSLSSFAHASTNGSAQLISIRTKPKDFSSSRLKTLEEADGNEEVAKTLHGRSRSVSQTNSSTISSSPSSFDRNFPTLAKKKQFPLSVDLQTKGVDNMWANSDTKSKLLSPTSTQVLDEPINDSIDDEPELERRMSLVPKVESGKLDGKRAIKNTIKRKTSRSLSMDSAARSPTISSGFGFGVGIGISSGRAAGQSQHFRPYLKESVAAKSTNVHPQRPRAMSISASNGAKKTTVATTTLPRGTGQTLISKRLSIGGNSKYIWMGKMGNFKMISDDEELSNERKEDHINEEEEDQESESIETDDSAQKRGVNSNLDQSANDMSRSCDVELSTEQVCDAGSTESNQSDQEDSLPQSLEREENFLRQLGWQKPYDNDDSQWAITEEEKRLFINLVRALNGISVNEKNGFDSEKALSNGEINRANKNWAATVMVKKKQNGDICIQSEDSKTSIEYLRLLT